MTTRAPELQTLHAARLAEGLLLLEALLELLEPHAQLVDRVDLALKHPASKASTHTHTPQ